MRRLEMVWVWVVLVLIALADAESSVAGCKLVMDGASGVGFLRLEGKGPDGPSDVEFEDVLNRYISQKADRRINKKEKDSRLGVLRKWDEADERAVLGLKAKDEAERRQFKRLLRKDFVVSETIESGVLGQLFNDQSNYRLKRSLRKWINAKLDCLMSCMKGPPDSMKNICDHFKDDYGIKGPFKTKRALRKQIRERFEIETATGPRPEPESFSKGGDETPCHQTSGTNPAAGIKIPEEVLKKCSVFTRENPPPLPKKLRPKKGEAPSSSKKVEAPSPPLPVNEKDEFDHVEQDDGRESPFK